VPGRPEVDGDRCVHARIETATCRACVEECPMMIEHVDAIVAGLLAAERPLILLDTYERMAAIGKMK